MSSPIRLHPAAVALAALAWTVLAAPPVGAQVPALYALNQSGSLSVDATVIDDLPGSGWVALVVDGSDRYALRDDGLVFKNGAKLYKLACTDGNDQDLVEGDWVGLTIVEGSVWALSKRGYLAQDGSCVTQLTPGDFEFAALFTGPTGNWSLRSDGAVFANTTAANTFAFTAGPGLQDGLGEGQAPDTSWLSGTVGPDGKVYAVRRDGNVVRGDLLGEGDPPTGTIVAELPFGNTATAATLYASIAFTDDGSWNVLRGGGQLFREPNTLNPFLEFNSGDQTFVDLLPLPADPGLGTTDTSLIALRKDGNIFRETGVASVGDLPKSGFTQLALSLDPPDLTNIENALPVVAKYTVQAVTGEPASFPILGTDTDKAAADLVVTVDETTLPAGATYDGKTRTVSWDSPVKGSAKVKVEVDDGVGNPVEVTCVVKVKDPDTNPDKNAGPRVSKIKNVQGLVGIPLELPILASDVDGDELTISVDETDEPFTLGASFDALTSTFSWPDPTLSDIGSYKVKFDVSDGTKTVTLTVTVKIVTSLLGF